jgi:hypothetical protein
MIEIRIRLEDWVEAVHLCTWPATELDRLLPTIRAWGIQGHEVSTEPVGQFVVNDGAAFFEVIVLDVEADA